MDEWKTINAENYKDWSSEDLTTLYKELIRQRDFSEMFTDRADLNRRALWVMSELQTRNNYVKRKSN